jgi:hypothetical protein
MKKQPPQTTTRVTLPLVRCAIYTRKSTEEGLAQEFNGLALGVEAGEAFIRSQTSEGWTCLPERYDDGGFTGPTWPAYRRVPNVAGVPRPVTMARGRKKFALT